MAVSDAAALELPDELQTILEDLQDSANARAVFGDPVEREGKTVIPVARVALGFGGGFGSGPADGSNGEEAGEELTVTVDEIGEGPGGSGAGGGGGAMARPVGALEITDHDTRFVPIGSDRRRAAALVGLGIGFLLGRWLGRRAGRRSSPAAE